MRRLPIYFLVDVSSSNNIDKATDVINCMLCSIRHEPYLLETAYISIVTIGKEPNIALTLTEGCIIEALPELKCENEVALGKALALLMEDIDKNVVKSTIEQRGDYRPITFLFIDNAPTDKYSTMLDQWILKHGRNIFISVSTENSASFLKPISNAIVSYDQMRIVASKILRWIATYPVEAPIANSPQEATAHFNIELDEFLNRNF